LPRVAGGKRLPHRIGLVDVEGQPDRPEQASQRKFRHPSVIRVQEGGSRNQHSIHRTERAFDGRPDDLLFVFEGVLVVVEWQLN
jgi:hypothetical protein